MIWLGVAVLWCAPSPTSAQAVGSRAETAVALCRSADQLSSSARQSVLEHGLRVAEAAVTADPNDAQAHFAVFCNLGKEIQTRGLSLGDVADVGRLRHELDTALALAPADPDFLAAKGALLLALPWFLGGDADEGEHLLRQALSKDPENTAARRSLANALRSRGEDPADQ